MSRSGLEPPAARQGPGPVPEGVFHALDVALSRMVARSLPGDRRAIGVGVGGELAQLRPYEIGDDVRHLDAAATARSGQPHVRLHVPERALTTWILRDASPSMAFGTAMRLKADVAEGAALVMGRLAVRRTGTLGMITFGAGGLGVIAPHGSRPGLVAMRRAIAEGIAPDGRSEPTGLADAVGRLITVARQPGLVVIISDFRDQHGWARGIETLSRRHSVLAIEVGDPRERHLPSIGRLAVVDPETGEHATVDTSDGRVRARFAQIESRRREALGQELRRLRLKHVELSTAGDWLRQLGDRLT